MQANEDINNYLKLPRGGIYTYLNFEFKPYEKEKVLVK